MCTVTFTNVTPAKEVQVPLQGLYTLPEFSEDVDSRQYFDKWKVAMDGEVYYYDPGESFTVTADAYITSTLKNCAQLLGYSVSLEGDIGATFFMVLAPEFVNSSDAYVQFTLPDGSKPTIKMSDVKDKPVTINGIECYGFKCNIAAKDISETITAQFIVNDVVKSREFYFTVESYANYLVESTSEHAYGTEYNKNLAEALLIYGAYAQRYFGVGEIHQIDPADYELNSVVNSVVAADIAPYNANSVNLTGDVTFAGASLGLRTKTTLTLYFKSDKELSFECPTAELDTDEIGGYKIVRIHNINAKNLGGSFVINVTGDGISGSVTYSPMTYCYNVLNGESYSPDLKDVCRSLYVFHQKANA